MVVDKITRVKIIAQLITFAIEKASSWLSQFFVLVTARKHHLGLVRLLSDDWGLISAHNVLWFENIAGPLIMAPSYKVLVGAIFADGVGDLR